jgi:predicted P-loop ATPase
VTNLEAALSYALSNWSVLPIVHLVEGACSCGRDQCKSAGKHPDAKLVPNGLDGATRDEAQIRAWWDAEPRNNVAVRTGDASGILVIDVDPKNGGEEGLAKLEAEIGAMPATLTATTGSGGRHYIFVRPDLPALGNGRGELRGFKGIDVRCDRGYVVVAPSAHVSGGTYGWDNWGSALAAVPAALLRMIRGLRDEGAFEDRFARNDSGRIAAGNQDEYLFKKGCKLLAEGHTTDEIAATLKTLHASRLSTARPDDRDRDVEKIMRSVMRYANARGDFAVKKSGEIRMTQGNVRLAIAALGVKLTHNRFNDERLVDNRRLTDDELRRLWLRVDSTFDFRPSKEFFWDVALTIADESPFHPVRDYLEGLVWDGQPRVDGWLATYMGAENTDYVRAVGRLFLVAAVRRVRDPGCKFDEMLVLESPQGYEKSTALETLAMKREWFNDKLDLGSRDAQKQIEMLHGHWIIEVADMQGYRLAEVNTLKAFLSRTVDKYRTPYARLTSQFPRQCVVVGTTNDDSYLRDATGNRRFWPVRVDRVTVAALERDRDQLWAEAARMERDGASIRLAKSLWSAAGAEQEARYVDDPWEDVIRTHFEGVTGQVSARDVWSVVGVPTERQQSHDARRLVAAMARVGWVRTRFRRDGAPVRGFVRGTDEEREVQWKAPF